MGKRKLHGVTYYQCDWPGFPMRESNCWMPSWTCDGKLIKRGCYCNWESVLAHADHLHEVEKQLIDSDVARVRDYVKMQIHTVHATPALHYTDLEHFKGDGLNLTAKEFHAICCHQHDDVFGVKINEAGNSYEVLMESIEGTFDFSKYLKAPGNWNVPPNEFQATRKGKKKETSLFVFYHSVMGTGNGLEFNSVASSIFKMKIYGEVLLVQCTNEPSFMPRKRYVNYTTEEFEDDFTRKRKRCTEIERTSMDQTEYEDIKAEMQLSLSDYEKQASSLAAPPHLAKVQKLPPMNGRQLAALEKARRQGAA